MAPVRMPVEKGIIPPKSDTCEQLLPLLVLQ